MIVSEPDTPPGFSYIDDTEVSLDGRSPDLRIKVFPDLPKPTWLSGIFRGHSPFTVAGAVADLEHIWRNLTAFPFHFSRMFNG